MATIPQLIKRIHNQLLQKIVEACNGKNGMLDITLTAAQIELLNKKFAPENIEITATHEEIASLIANAFTNTDWKKAIAAAVDKIRATNIGFDLNGNLFRQESVLGQLDPNIAEYVKDFDLSTATSNSITEFNTWFEEQKQKNISDSNLAKILNDQIKIKLKNPISFDFETVNFNELKTLLVLTRIENPIIQQLFRQAKLNLKDVTDKQLVQFNQSEHTQMLTENFGFGTDLKGFQDHLNEIANDLNGNQYSEDVFKKLCKDIHYRAAKTHEVLARLNNPAIAEFLRRNECDLSNTSSASIESFNKWANELYQILDDRFEQDFEEKLKQLRNGADSTDFEKNPIAPKVLPQTLAAIKTESVLPQIPEPLRSELRERQIDLSGAKQALIDKFLYNLKYGITKSEWVKNFSQQLDDSLKALAKTETLKKLDGTNAVTFTAKRLSDELRAKIQYNFFKETLDSDATGLMLNLREALAHADLKGDLISWSKNKPNCWPNINDFITVISDAKPGVDRLCEEIAAQFPGIRANVFKELINDQTNLFIRAEVKYVNLINNLKDTLKTLFSDIELGEILLKLSIKYPDATWPTPQQLSDAISATKTTDPEAIYSQLIGCFPQPWQDDLKNRFNEISSTETIKIIPTRKPTPIEFQKLLAETYFSAQLCAAGFEPFAEWLKDNHAKISSHLLIELNPSIPEKIAQLRTALSSKVDDKHIQTAFTVFFTGLVDDPNIAVKPLLSTDKTIALSTMGHARYRQLIAYDIFKPGQRVQLHAVFENVRDTLIAWLSDSTCKIPTEDELHIAAAGVVPANPTTVSEAIAALFDKRTEAQKLIPAINAATAVAIVEEANSQQPQQQAKAVGLSALENILKIININPKLADIKTQIKPNIDLSLLSKELIIARNAEEALRTISKLLLKGDNSNTLDAYAETLGLGKKSNEEVFSESVHTTVSNPDVESRNTNLKPRKALKDETKLKAVLAGKIPNGLILGEAHGQGDCFFDALAQSMNQANETDVNTDKYLRMQCHDFYGKNKDLVDEWNAREFGGIVGRKDEYYLVQYTADECKKLFHDRTPILGRPNIEGRILCQQLNLEGICVIEILEDPATKQPILSFHLANKDTYKSISEEEAQAWLENSKIPALVVEQNSLHFVPLLNISKLAKKPSVTQLSEHSLFNQLVREAKDAINCKNLFGALEAADLKTLVTALKQTQTELVAYLGNIEFPDKEELAVAIEELKKELRAAVNTINPIQVTQDAISNFLDIFKQEEEIQEEIIADDDLDLALLDLGLDNKDTQKNKKPSAKELAEKAIPAPTALKIMGESRYHEVLEKLKAAGLDPVAEKINGASRVRDAIITHLSTNLLPDLSAKISKLADGLNTLGSNISKDSASYNFVRHQIGEFLEDLVLENLVDGSNKYSQTVAPQNDPNNATLIAAGRFAQLLLQQTDNDAKQFLIAHEALFQTYFVTNTNTIDKLSKDIANQLLNYIKNFDIDPTDPVSQQAALITAFEAVLNQNKEIKHIEDNLVAAVLWEKLNKGTRLYLVLLHEKRNHADTVAALKNPAVQEAIIKYLSQNGTTIETLKDGLCFDLITQKFNPYNGGEYYAAIKTALNTDSYSILGQRLYLTDAEASALTLSDLGGIWDILDDKQKRHVTLMQEVKQEHNPNGVSKKVLTDLIQLLGTHDRANTIQGKLAGGEFDLNVLRAIVTKNLVDAAANLNLLLSMDAMRCKALAKALDIPRRHVKTDAANQMFDILSKGQQRHVALVQEVKADQLAKRQNAPNDGSLVELISFLQGPDPAVDADAAKVFAKAIQTKLGSQPLTWEQLRAEVTKNLVNDEDLSSLSLFFENQNLPSALANTLGIPVANIIPHGIKAAKQVYEALSNGQKHHVKLASSIIKANRDGAVLNQLVTLLRSPECATAIQTQLAKPDAPLTWDAFRTKLIVGLAKYPDLLNDTPVGDQKIQVQHKSARQTVIAEILGIKSTDVTPDAANETFAAVTAQLQLQAPRETVWEELCAQVTQKLVKLQLQLKDPKAQHSISLRQAIRDTLNIGGTTLSDDALKPISIKIWDALTAGQKNYVTLAEDVAQLNKDGSLDEVAAFLSNANPNLQTAIPLKLDHRIEQKGLPPLTWESLLAEVTKKLLSDSATFDVEDEKTLNPILQKAIVDVLSINKEYVPIEAAAQIGKKLNHGQNNHVQLIQEMRSKHDDDKYNLSDVISLLADPDLTITISDKLKTRDKPLTWDDLLAEIITALVTTDATFNPEDAGERNNQIRIAIAKILGIKTDNIPKNSDAPEQIWSALNNGQKNHVRLVQQAQLLNNSPEARVSLEDFIMLLKNNSLQTTIQSELDNWQLPLQKNILDEFFARFTNRMVRNPLSGNEQIAQNKIPYIDNLAATLGIDVAELPAELDRSLTAGIIGAIGKKLALGRYIQLITNIKNEKLDHLYTFLIDPNFSEQIQTKLGNLPKPLSLKGYFDKPNNLLVEDSLCNKVTAALFEIDPTTLLGDVSIRQQALATVFGILNPADVPKEAGNDMWNALTDAQKNHVSLVRSVADAHTAANNLNHVLALLKNPVLTTAIQTKLTPPNPELNWNALCEKVTDALANPAPAGTKLNPKQLALATVLGIDLKNAALVTSAAANQMYDALPIGHKRYLELVQYHRDAATKAAAGSAEKQGHERLVTLLIQNSSVKSQLQLNLDNPDCSAETLYIRLATWLEKADHFDPNNTASRQNPLKAALKGVLGDATDTNSLIPQNLNDIWDYLSPKSLQGYVKLAQQAKSTPENKPWSNLFATTSTPKNLTDIEKNFANKLAAGQSLPTVDSLIQGIAALPTPPNGAKVRAYLTDQLGISDAALVAAGIADDQQLLKDLLAQTTQNLALAKFNIIFDGLAKLDTTINGDQVKFFEKLKTWLTTNKAIILAHLQKGATPNANALAINANALLDSLLKADETTKLAPLLKQLTNVDAQPNDLALAVADARYYAIVENPAVKNSSVLTTAFTQGAPDGVKHLVTTALQTGVNNPLNHAQLISRITNPATTLNNIVDSLHILGVVDLAGAADPKASAKTLATKVYSETQFNALQVAAKALRDPTKAVITQLLAAKADDIKANIDAIIQHNPNLTQQAWAERLKIATDINSNRQQVTDALHNLNPKFSAADIQKLYDANHGRTAQLDWLKAPLLEQWLKAGPDRLADFTKTTALRSPQDLAIRRAELLQVIANKGAIGLTFSDPKVKESTANGILSSDSTRLISPDENIEFTGEARLLVEFENMPIALQWLQANHERWQDAASQLGKMSYEKAHELIQNIKTNIRDIDSDNLTQTTIEDELRSIFNDTTVAVTIDDEPQVQNLSLLSTSLTREDTAIQAEIAATTPAGSTPAAKIGITEKATAAVAGSIATCLPDAYVTHIIGEQRLLSQPALAILLRPYPAQWSAAAEMLGQLNSKEAEIFLENLTTAMQQEILAAEKDKRPAAILKILTTKHEIEAPALKMSVTPLVSSKQRLLLDNQATEITPKELETFQNCIMLTRYAQDLADYARAINKPPEAQPSISEIAEKEISKIQKRLNERSNKMLSSVNKRNRIEKVKTAGATISKATQALKPADQTNGIAAGYLVSHTGAQVLELLEGTGDQPGLIISVNTAQLELNKALKKLREERAICEEVLRKAKIAVKQLPKNMETERAEAAKIVARYQNHLDELRDEEIPKCIQALNDAGALLSGLLRRREEIRQELSRYATPVNTELSREIVDADTNMENWMHTHQWGTPTVASISTSSKYETADLPPGKMLVQGIKNIDGMKDQNLLMARTHDSLEILAYPTESGRRVKAADDVVQEAHNIRSNIRIIRGDIDPNIVIKMYAESELDKKLGGSGLRIMLRTEKLAGKSGLGLGMIYDPNEIYFPGTSKYKFQQAIRKEMERLKQAPQAVKPSEQPMLAANANLITPDHIPSHGPGGGRSGR